MMVMNASWESPIKGPTRFVTTTMAVAATTYTAPARGTALRLSAASTPRVGDFRSVMAAA